MRMGFEQTIHCLFLKPVGYFLFDLVSGASFIRE